MLNTNFIPFPTLTTDRLVLRQIEIGDIDDIFAHRSDEIVNRYLDNFRHASIAETEAFVHRIQNEVSIGKTILWVLTLKGQNKFMGTMCLWNISKAEDKAEVGYTMCSEFHGKGYMVEALAKAIDFGFNTMNLRTIEAYTHKDNARSIKLLVGNNFKQSPKAPNENNRVVFHLKQ